MKKVLLVGAIALFGAMNAQMEKGSFVIGGTTNLGFNNVSTKFSFEGESADGNKTSTFSFSPTVGYFVIDKLAIGLDLGFGSITTKDDDYKETISTFSVMPTGTYYFKNTSKVVPYLGAGIGYGSTKYKGTFENESDDVTVDGLAWKAKGGIVYLINPNIGVDLGVGFNQFTNKEDISGGEFKTTTSTFGVNLGFSIFLK